MRVALVAGMFACAGLAGSEAGGAAAGHGAAPRTAAADLAPGDAGAGGAAAVRRAWEACARDLGLPADPPARVRRFGETPETIARILPLVVGGEKTITSTTPWVYESNPEERPRVGAYSVIVDAEGAPRAVLRTTEVKTVRFDEVTEDDSRYEGAPVRPLAAWREVHVRYFTRVLARVGREFSPDMPVTLERFAVVCRT